MAVRGFPALIHCKSSFANAIAGKQLIWIFCVSPVLWDDSLALMNIQVCDLRETLAFHNDKSAGHDFLRGAAPPGCRSGQ